MNIKTCPFCGDVCEVVSTTFGDWSKAVYTVRCLGDKQHSLDSWSETEEEAIQEWNERDTFN